MPNKLQVSLIEYRPFADTLGSVDVIIAVYFFAIMIMTLLLLLPTVFHGHFW